MDKCKPSCYKFPLFATLAALTLCAKVSQGCWKPTQVDSDGETLANLKTGASVDCTPEVARRQLDQFMKEWETSEGKSSSCAEHWWLRQVAELKVNSSELHTLMMDVGCNKGYFSATALNYLAPGYGDHLQRFYQSHLARGIYSKPCGGCNECTQGHPAAPPPVGSSAGGPQQLRQQETVDVLCYEPSEVHIESLARARSALYGAPSRRAGSHEGGGALARPSRTTAAAAPNTRVNFYIRRRAVSNHTGTVSFPVNCTVNTCSMGQGGHKAGVTDFVTSKASTEDVATQTMEVEATTIDAEMASMGDRFLDVLKIDTEGFDPVVLAGAYHSLRAHRIGALSFEYHHLWSRSGGSLRQCMDYLEELGYACFYDAPVLARITGGCWADTYELRSWANIVCAVQGSAMDEALIAGSYLKGQTGAKARRMRRR